LLAQVSILQKPVLERKTLFFPLTPLLKIEVNIGALFVFVIDYLGFFMPLEPHHVFGVKPPGLLFKSLGRQILSLGSLHVIKDEEECFRGESQEEI